VTCIAAAAQDGRVWMAADSLACNEYVAIQLADDDPKIFKVGDVLFGVTGEHRINQVLRYGLELPSPDATGSELRWLVCAVVPAIRECLRAACMLEVVNGIERMGTDMLLILGYRGRIYRIERDFVVVACASSYFAAGSGLEFALGSLHATTQYAVSHVEDPEKRVVMAVQAAAHHGRGVRAPITVEVV
jgi:ATP-dependent protease HslVU (ClpYQ) peptidase subunit